MTTEEKRKNVIELYNDIAEEYSDEFFTETSDN